MFYSLLVLSLSASITSRSNLDTLASREMSVPSLAMSHGAGRSLMSNCRASGLSHPLPLKICRQGMSFSSR